MLNGLLVRRAWNGSGARERHETYLCAVSSVPSPRRRLRDYPTLIKGLMSITSSNRS